MQINQALLFLGKLTNAIQIEQIAIQIRFLWQFNILCLMPLRVCVFLLIEDGHPEVYKKH